MRWAPAALLLCALAAAGDPKEEARIARIQVAAKARRVDEVPRLLETLEGKFPRLRFEAAVALSEIDPGCEAAVPHLIDGLRHNEWATRFRAAIAVGRFGERARPAVALLTSLLDDRMLDMRREAVLSLGRIGPAAAGATPQLAELLLVEDWHMQVNVALALARIGPSAMGAAKDLLRLTEHENPFVREAGIQATAAMGRAVRPRVVKELADGPDGWTEAWGRIRRGRIHAAWHVSAAAEEKSRFAALPENRVGINALRAVLMASSPARRAGAAAQLGNWRHHADVAVTALVGLLDDDDTGVRRAAVLALGRIRAGGPMPDELEALLADRVPAVRLAALRAHLGGRPKERVVLRMVKDEIAWIRVVAVRGLVVFGGDASEELIGRLEKLRGGPDAQLRTEARAALARLVAD